MRMFVLSATAFVTVTIALAAQPAFAYTVRGGDTLWGISRRTGVSVERLARDNHVKDPDRIYIGQQLDLPTPATSPKVGPTATPPPSPLSRREARQLLAQAASDRGVSVSLVLAVAYWESGWNQAMVSKDGAVGMMQVTPGTATWAGPALLGRRVDLHDARDNAQLGAALLRRYTDEFKDPKLVLAAYYEGAAAAHKYGVYPSSRGYVNGILALRARFEAST